MNMARSERHQRRLLGNLRADECRREILEGITTLPQLRTPRKLVVYGVDAIPILCGQDAGDVLVACAELGKGRVLVVGDSSYLGEITSFASPSDDAVARFQKNVKLWVSRGECDRDREVCHLGGGSTGDSFWGTKVAVCSGMDLSDDVAHALTDFVIGGGGLICGVDAWKWVQENKGRELTEMPLSSLLDTVGIHCTNERMAGSPNGFNVRESFRKEGGLHLQTVEDQAAWQKALQDCGLELPHLKRNQYYARKWRKEILYGMSTLPKLGLPARITVFSDNAAPILSAEKDEDVLLASSKFGSGRIIVVGHDLYLKAIMRGHGDPEVAKLMENMKDWVSNYTYKTKSEISIWALRRGKLKLRPRTKIVVWKGGKTLDQESQDEVADFVERGGGLICGLCSWSWLRHQQNRSLHDIPVHSLLEAAGLHFTKHPIYDEADGFDIVASLQKPSGGFHLGFALKKATHLQYVEKNGHKITAALKDLSREEFNQFRSKLQHIGDTHEREFRECAPTPSRPVKTTKQKNIMALCSTLFHRRVGMNKAPGISIFPGDFEVLPPLQYASFQFESVRKDLHPTGFYLPAGVKATIEVEAMEGPEPWEIRIGAHKDKLYHKNAIKRWPDITIDKTLAANSAKSVRSPFGGLIYFISPREPGKLEVKLEGVVEAPCFDLRVRRSTKDWSRRRQAPGLWADISGKFITITVPSRSVRDLDAPWEVMELWDQVVLSHNELRGTHPRDRWREFVVCDTQISMGSMHSGHPIMTHMSPSVPGSEKFLLDKQIFQTTGFWGIFHELGHNMQKRYWTFEGTKEVTCNIFSLHAMDVICGIKPLDHMNITRAQHYYSAYLNGGIKNTKWELANAVKLAVYAQLAHHFGWDAYKKVFRKYEKMEPEEKPRNNQLKIDTWVQIFSRKVGHNLCPLFEFWGIPFSDEVKQKLASLPPSLPEDKITDLAVERVLAIKRTYGISTSEDTSASRAQSEQHCTQEQLQAEQELCEFSGSDDSA